MRVDQAIKKCLDNGIKVYPVHDKYNRRFIEAEINGKKKRFDKPITEKQINKALEDTYKFYAKKL